MKLSTLSLNNNSIRDLTPLHGHGSLNSLGIEDNSISDLTPLAGNYMGDIYLKNNCITDFTPVSHYMRISGMDQQYNHCR
jgi:Leucine-rich repeat (LRR) protein